MKGVFSYFPTRKPTREEYEACTLDNRIKLTNQDSEWDPSTTNFEEQESNMVDSDGKLRDQPIRWRADRAIAALHTLPQEHQPDNDFGRALEGTVMATWPNDGHQTRKATTATQRREASIQSLQTSKRKYAIGAAALAKNWGIGIAAATRTVEATTQKGVRTILHPTLSRRFRTNDRQ